jgi:hypothetical protein
VLSAKISLWPTPICGLAVPFFRRVKDGMIFFLSKNTVITAMMGSRKMMVDTSYLPKSVK